MNDPRTFLFKIQKSKNKQNASINSGELSERKNVLDLNILVCIDVSGSISNEQFRQFMKQIDAIRGLSRVKVMEVDTDVVAMYNYFKVEQARVIRRNGTGGTAFHSAFQKAKEMKPDAILFMTDGYVADHVSNPGIPTGWVLTAGGQKPYDFGEVIVNLKSPRMRY